METMEEKKPDRAEHAVWLKHHGYNCCMAVLVAYMDELDISEDILRRFGVAFGSGMGDFEGTCGALCGAEMLLGLKEYEGVPLHAKAKEIYRLFEEACGHTICKDLKGLETGKVLCSCDDCIRNAVGIIEARRQKAEK